MKKVAGASPLLWAALAGVGILAFTQRKTIMIYGQKALEAAMREYFILSLDSSAQDYGDVILRVAREQNVDPFLIVAIGERESGWGTMLSPRGPAGKGDAGHGHGIMQIDDRSWGSWLASNPWWDPYTNVTKGVQIFKGNLSFFSGQGSVPGLASGGRVTLGQTAAARRGVPAGAYPDPRPLAGDPLVRAALAAYNTGPGNALASIAAGKDPDLTTSGSLRSLGAGDYSTDVVRRMLAAVDSFQKTAPA